ncbi:MAG: hypothetical protein CL908_11030 [Deltaproteobacteria bacterium]|nr:hypothetical protein [Deltaproteobacteria bacterium]
MRGGRGLAQIGLLALLLIPQAPAYADPASPASVGVAPGISSEVPLGALAALDSIAHEAAAPVAAQPTPMVEAELADLLRVPGPPATWSDAPTTDEAIAAAVALGTNPDLEPRNAFRKRSRDLFRTERPVEIGRAEMLLRLRLRAKTRKAMSVELRF